MNKNSVAIISLCSHMCSTGVTPLEPREWSELALILMQKEIQPEALLEYSQEDFVKKIGVSQEYATRLSNLIGRTASLYFELSRYENMGIRIVTRADSGYPKALKRKLGNSCPPLFYYAGDLSILERKAIGFVGSRTVGNEDVDFTEKLVRVSIEQGYAIVSGGAKGIDTTAEECALQNGAYVIEYLSDSMLKKIKASSTVKAIQNRKLLLLSVVKPDAPFMTGIAMMRNRYIYSQSEATIVVKSDLNKGGTWAGAQESLKLGLTKTLCWDNPTYKGNQALISQGATPISDTWNGIIDEIADTPKNHKQISMFD